MKRSIAILAYLTIIGALLTSPALALFREEFTLTQEFRSSRHIDFDFTSAWYDKLGKRVVASRTYGVREVPLSTLDVYQCDVDVLISNFSLEGIERNKGCKVTPSGVLVYGFSRDDESREWVGRIYLVEGSSVRLINPLGLFRDARLGGFLIGVKHASEFLVIYTIRPAQFYSYQGGSWMKQTNEELQALRLSSNLHIAWSGKAWFFSRGGRNLDYFDGTLLVAAFGQIPRTDFSIRALETSLQANGFIISDNNQAFLVQDSGYANGVVVESRTIRPRGRFDITELVLEPDATTPSGTSLHYLASVDRGSHWSTASPGGRVSFAHPGEDLRWQIVFASSNPNSTPVVNGLTTEYITKDVAGERAGSRDSMRLRDLAKVEGYIRTYFDEVGHDPLIGDHSPHNKAQIWEGLRTALVNQAGNQRDRQSYRRSIERGFPSQPSGESNEFLYGYWTTSGGTDFLLYVALEQEDSSALQKDIDGILFGINCNDPVYCTGKGLQVAEQLRKSTEERLIRYLYDYRVYFVKDGVKRWIVNERAFERNNFRWQDVEIVPLVELNQYPTGQAIQ